MIVAIEVNPSASCLHRTASDYFCLFLDLVFLHKLAEFCTVAAVIRKWHKFPGRKKQLLAELPTAVYIITVYTWHVDPNWSRGTIGILSKSPILTWRVAWINGAGGIGQYEAAHVKFFSGQSRSWCHVDPCWRYHTIYSWTQEIFGLEVNELTIPPTWILYI